MKPRMVALDLDDIEQPIDPALTPEQQLAAKINQAANRILLLTQGIQTTGVTVCEHINDNSYRYATQHWLPGYIWCGGEEDCAEPETGTSTCSLCSEPKAATAYLDLGVADLVGDGTVPWSIYMAPLCEAHRDQMSDP